MLIGWISCLGFRQDPPQVRWASSLYICCFLWPQAAKELWRRLSGQAKYESKWSLFAQYCNRWEDYCLLIPATQGATPYRPLWPHCHKTKVPLYFQAGVVGAVAVWCFPKFIARWLRRVLWRSSLTCDTHQQRGWWHRDVPRWCTCYLIPTVMCYSPPHGDKGIEVIRQFVHLN